jgi:hypothetical protein
MRYITTRHSRSIHLLAAVLIFAAAIIRDQVDSGFLLPHKKHLLYGALAIAAFTLFFVEAPEEPPRAPKLSLLQLRILGGVALLMPLLAALNHYLLTPGFLSPHTGELLAASFMPLMLFAVLYMPQIRKLSSAKESHGARDA